MFSRHVCSRHPARLSLSCVAGFFQITNIVAVILHTSLQEKFFNPFYSQVLGRLCGFCCCGSAPRPSLPSASDHPPSSSSSSLSSPMTSSSSLLSRNGKRIGGSERRNFLNAGLFESSACTCFFLPPAKEGMKFRRVLQRGLAAQNSAAHGYTLRRLLHLAKLEAFLVRSNEKH